MKIATLLLGSFLLAQTYEACPVEQGGATPDTPTLEQEASIEGTSVAYGEAVTPGNLLVCGFVGLASSATVSVADDVNGAWTLADELTANGAYAGVFYFEETGAGTPTVTVTESGVSFDILWCSEWSGIADSPALADTAVASAPGTTFEHSSGEVVLPGAGLFLFSSQASGAPTITPPASYTLDVIDGTRDQVYAYRVVSAATTDTGTWASSTARSHTTVHVGFLAGEAAGPPPDTTAPTVAITAPAPSSTVAGSVNVTADAADNVGVAGVQFLLDDVNLGAEDTTAPYAVVWDTTLDDDGEYTLTAEARDAADNTTVSDPVTVTVDNTTPPAEVLFGPAFQDVIDGVEDVDNLANPTNATNLYHQYRKLNGAVIADIGVTALTEAGFTLALTEQQYCDLADASYLADRTRMMSGQTDTHSDWADGYPEFQFWPAALFRVWCDPYLSTQRQSEIEADFVDVLESFFGATPWACDATSIPFVSHIQFINNRGIENLAMLPLALALEDQEDPWWVLADCVFRERIPDEAAAYLSQGYWDMEASADYMRMTTTWLLTTYAVWFSDQMETEVWLNDLGSFYDDLWSGTQWLSFGTATSNLRTMNYFCRAIGVMQHFDTTSGAAAAYQFVNDGNCMSATGAGLLRYTGLWGNWIYAWPYTAQSTWLPLTPPAEQGPGQREHGNGWYTSDAGDKLHIFAKLVDGYGHDSNHAGAVYIVDTAGEILVGQQLGNKNGTRRYTSSHGRHHGINVSCYSGSGVQFNNYDGWSDVPSLPPQYDMETVGVVQEVDTSDADFLYHRYGRNFGGSDSQGSPGLIQEIVHLYDERIIVGRYTYGTLNCEPVWLAHIADQFDTGDFPQSTITIQSAQLDTSAPLDNYYHDMQDADEDEGGDSIIGGNFNFQMPDCMRIMCGNVRSYDIPSGFMWVVQLGDVKQAVSFDGGEATIGGISVTINGTGAVVTGL